MYGAVAGLENILQPLQNSIAWTVVTADNGCLAACFQGTRICNLLE